MTHDQVLRDTVESMRDGFFTLDRAFRFTYVNAAAEKLLSHPRDALLGENIWEKFPSAVGTESDEAYTRAMKERIAVTFQQYYPPFQSWLQADVHPISDGIAVYFRDVTERHLERETLREHARLLDKATDAIVVCNLEHAVTYWNASAERIFGWTSAEAIGKPLPDLVFTDRAAFLHVCDTALARGEWLGELDQVTKTKQRRVIECSWTLVRDEEGKPKSFLAINTDATDRKKMEAEYLRAQRMESIGTLAGGIAHDLNNTLTPILMTVSLLRESEDDPTRIEDLASIEGCVQRAASLVQQLLSFARGSEVRRQRVDLALVSQSIQQLVRESFPKNITLRLSMTGEGWTVRANETQMQQLMTNLCVNARDAMQGGGTLTLAIERTVLDEVYAQMNLDAKPGPYVLIRVEDTGIGMPRDIVDRIFEPFFTTKEAGKGTGLGLSTAHAIVKNHGGFIHVYSELGKGTRFRVYLPAEVSEEDSAREALERSPLPRGNGELVLVVDDEQPIREVARRTLERFGYRVEVASNGAEAVSRFAQMQGAVAVVLTDMNMPVMDGPSTILALQTIDPKVRIIGSSGLDANGHVAKAVGAGVKHFVPKPYTAELILRTLHAILNEG